MVKAIQIYKMLLLGQLHWEKNYFCVKTMAYGEWPVARLGQRLRLDLLGEASHRPSAIDQLTN